MQRILLLLFCFLFLSQSRFVDDIEYLTEINNNIVIGIFTQPSDPDYVDYPASQYSYLAASYVKFVEMAGARVVPIPYEADNTILEKYFLGINGTLYILCIIIPGGASDLDTPTGPSKFAKAVAYMVNRAIQVNEAGEVFPVLGICMGFQTLHYIISGYKTPFLYRVYGENGMDKKIIQTILAILQRMEIELLHYIRISMTTLIRQCKLINIYIIVIIGVQVQTCIKSIPLWMHSSELLEPIRIQRVKYLQLLCKVNNIQYLVFNIIQRRTFLNGKFQLLIVIWLLRYTKLILNQKYYYIIIINLIVSANHIDAFVNYARLNNHQFNAEQLNKAVIYNFKTVQEKNASFVQVYFFKNGELSL